jgi:hypothetical protein
VNLVKLVSGGQTGVDRGALDAALSERFPCGGWCPAGRLAEDGAIPARYPVVPLNRGGYFERTVQNVADSDGTLVIYFERLHGGTEETVIECIRRQKPYKLVDGSEIGSERAAQLAARFVADHHIAVLNVAGPRGSHSPTGYAYAFDTIARLLRERADAASAPEPVDRTNGA